MKRFFTIFLCLTLAALLTVPAWAAMDTSLPRVVDELDWLEGEPVEKDYTVDEWLFEEPSGSEGDVDEWI